MRLRCAGLVLVAALALPAAAAAAPLQLVLPLRTDTRGLTQFADRVSNPASPDYGDYASVAWLAQRFGAPATTRRQVVTYLRAHGATDVAVDGTGQLVEARIGRADAERLFDTTLRYARGPLAARTLMPSSPAQLPRALRGLVTGIVGLDTASLDDDTPPASSGYQGPDPGATPSGCAAGTAQGGFTPNEYLDAYQYAPLQQQGLLGQGERVALIEINGFQASDLETFASCFGLHLPTIRTFSVARTGQLPAGGEATLDLELLDAAAPRLKSIDVYETRADAGDVLMALAKPLQSTGFKPQVISVSLGLCESETEKSVGKAGIDALERVLKVASAAGVSVLGASGDSGSAGCPNSSFGSSAPLPSLAVTFPASSPWVTSVGGTNFDLSAQNQISSQVVWNDAGDIPGSAAGGGVSELFTRPSWQDGVDTSPWRAEPDVAMLADVSPRYAVYCSAAEDCDGRGWISFGGTSAATPLLAGGFALVDEALRRQGHIALGLANPLLYRLGRDATSAAQVFYDVTDGSNDVGPFIQSSQQPLGCCSAAPGYDEASGWGGLNLQAFAQAALAAQRKLATVGIAVAAAQTPIASGGIYVELSCSAACDQAAYAKISARGMRSFSDYAFAHLIERNRRRLKLPFTPAQTIKLTAALVEHRRITARLFGAVVDAGGDIESQTRTLTLRVTS
ncbi:MAG TPA: S53 family peptidase [Solirubrobacteraceae bacterium]|nr:S53 family peptidase [Solirubrobacteraceae bacterium]